MKKQQIAKLGVTLGLVAAVGVGGTLAILSQTAGPVTNTFAVGENIESGDFVLDEAKVIRDGNGNYIVDPEAQARVQENTYDNLMPKATLAKDPTVSFTTAADDKMADCYMIVRIAGLEDLIEAGIVLKDDALGTNWLPITEVDSVVTVGSAVNNETYKDGYYIYKTNTTDDNATTGNEMYKITDPTEDTKLNPVFDGLKVNDNFDVSSFGDKNPVKIWACAVQFDNVSLDEAYDAAFAQMNTLS